MLAIIGGSGLYELPGFVLKRKEIVRTPYGLPSAPFYFGQFGQCDVVFLARHGLNHVWAPHEINYRANIWALHHVGAIAVISVSAVASLRESIQPGGLVIPHDIIDYTWGREQTFFEGQDQEVVHTDFREPYDLTLRDKILFLSESAKVEAVDSAVYGCVPGPRLETVAEAKRLAGDGVDLIGMTGMPEAILARELGLAYAHICGVIGYAANLAQPESQPDFRRQHTHQAMQQIGAVLTQLCELGFAD